MKRIPVTADALRETLAGLDVQAEGLLALAEELEAGGQATPERVRQHAAALEALREDLALSVPESLEPEQ